jgi:hypothetical protein
LPSNPQPLGQRALRGEVDLDLALQVLLGEELVLAHVGGDHPADLLGLQQDAEAEAVGAHVVGDDRQVAGAGVAQRVDEPERVPRQPEAADGDRHPVRHDVAERLVGAGPELGHLGSLIISPLLRPQASYGTVA